MSDKMKIMREKLLEYYGMDIDEAKSSFSTSNYAYIFPDDSIIRVGMSARRPRGQLVSEILWVDDVKRYGETVCEPFPSLRNNHFEEFEIEGVSYSATKFKKARGGLLTADQMDDWHAILLGNLLGRIHRASKEAEQSGIHYNRPDWKEYGMADIDPVAAFLEPDIMEKIKGILKQVDNIPRNADIYGMVHGDIGMNNYYIEGNNIWVFDFDECHYNFYMYDIASAIFGWFYDPNFYPGVPCREVIFEKGFLENFRKGYEYHMTLPEEEWEKLGLFLSVRIAGFIVGFATFAKENRGEGGVIQDAAALCNLAQQCFKIPDIYACIDQIIKMLGAVAQIVPSKQENQGSEKLQIFETPEGFQISGLLDTETAPLLDAQAGKLIEAGSRELKIDMAGVSYLSSAGIRVLLKTYKALDGNMKLVNVQDVVREVLENTGMAPLFIG